MSYDELYNKYLGLSKNHIYTDAIIILNELIIDYPLKLRLQWELGFALMDANLLDDSVDQFLQTLQRDRQCSPAWFGLGCAYGKQGRWPEAEIAYRNLFKLEQSLNHYIFLADALREQRKAEEALHYVEEAVRLGFESPELFLNHGLCLKDLDMISRSEGAFRRAIALDEHYEVALSQLGLLLLEQGRLDEAEQILIKAINASPNSWHANEYLKRLVSQKKDCIEASGWAVEEGEA
jgi:tetratricopeptide (TPR) repeat protein